ncbi:MAG: hypothetical protein GW949_01445 [Spirochaetales bacterium]|nr:hypothetical protein [Spirochaetales bacterium]
MKIALPVTTDQGAQAQLSDHFGHAPFFAVIEKGNPSVTFLTKAAHSRGQGGGCAPTAELKAAGISHVYCKGLGQGAYNRLTGEGISVGILDPTYTHLSQVLDAMGNDTLAPQTDPTLCAGHGHDHGHDHGHHHHH